MTIRIREGDVEADGERIANALTRYLTPRADQARFNWLYRRNPHGRVRVWLAVDGEGEIVGTAAAFPRRLYVGGEERNGWVFGDFCVSDGYRSLGPALMLQRALLESVASGETPIAYDFPSAAMMAVYRRLGIRPAGWMTRLAKPLKVNRIVRQRIRPVVLANTVSAFGNLLLTAQNLRCKEDPSLTFEWHAGRCEEEFTWLAESLRDSYGPCVQRSAEYLNWRYLENPYCTLRMITARRGGRLVGFAVFALTAEAGVIVDLFGKNDPAIVWGLVHEAAARSREAGAEILSTELWDSHPWRAVLKKAGFVEREAKPVVICWPCSARPALEGFGYGSWWLMPGDRDS